MVIACYNEEPILETSLEETLRVLDAFRWSFEIVFVDDASQDGTAAVIDRIIGAHPSRRLLKIGHVSNVGRGGTVADGIRKATGRFVGFLDIDLEVHARNILGCLLALQEGYDVATALRVYKFNWRSLDRYVLSTGYRQLVRWMLRLPLRDTETGFKFFRREAILPVLEATEATGWFWDTELMARAHHAGLRIIEIPALFIRRFDKQSSLHPVRDAVDYLFRLWRFRRVSKTLRSG